LLNDLRVIEPIREEIKRFWEVNENENMNYQNLWDTAKAVLRGKFIVMSAYIKRTGSSQINDLMLHLKLQEKQEQTKLNPKNIRHINRSIAHNEMEAVIESPKKEKSRT
jgi:hypothetical protein